MASSLPLGALSFPDRQSLERPPLEQIGTRGSGMRKQGMRCDTMVKLQPLSTQKGDSRAVSAPTHHEMSHRSAKPQSTVRSSRTTHTAPTRDFSEEFLLEGGLDSKINDRNLDQILGNLDEMTEGLVHDSLQLRRGREELRSIKENKQPAHRKKPPRDSKTSGPPAAAPGPSTRALTQGPAGGHGSTAALAPASQSASQRSRVRIEFGEASPQGPAGGPSTGAAQPEANTTSTHPGAAGAVPVAAPTNPAAANPSANHRGKKAKDGSGASSDRTKSSAKKSKKGGREVIGLFSDMPANWNEDGFSL